LEIFLTIESDLIINLIIFSGASDSAQQQVALVNGSSGNTAASISKYDVSSFESGSCLSDGDEIVSLSRYS
jgi:hypothetical protein